MRLHHQEAAPASRDPWPRPANGCWGGKEKSAYRDVFLVFFARGEGLSIENDREGTGRLQLAGCPGPGSQGAVSEMDAAMSLLTIVG